ncbi:MAG: TonB-dependent receptor [Myxococcota bacterium]|nr:TonB-dependent receptor [Myxococcota bacterium]
MVLAQAGVDDEGLDEAGVDDEGLDEAEAAEPIAPPSDVEVIRIKGRGISAIETDLPTSVTQFDAATIEALGAENVSDLAKVTPNVEIRTTGSTSATFFIRGVGLADFSANAAGAVAIYQDDAARNAPAIQLGQLFDIENVEVLRGPQSYGPNRNASAGAIKITSRKPTGEYQAQLRASFGTYASSEAKDAFIQDYEGALEVPIIAETLSARVAFRFRYADPFIRNGCATDIPVEARPRTRLNNPRIRPQDVVVAVFGDQCGSTNAIALNNDTTRIPAGLPKWVGDEGSWSARGIFRFQPVGTEMDWLLNAHGSKLDQQSTLGQAIGSSNNQFPGTTRFGYAEPDTAEEVARVEENKGVDVSTARKIVGKRLAETRPLDIRHFRGDYDRVGQTKLDTWGVTLRGDIPLGPATLTTVSSYDGYDRFRDTDQDFTPDILFESIEEDDAWQFYQDLRFFGELPDAPFRWEAGGFYLQESLDQLSDTFQNGRRTRTNLPFITFRRDFTQDIWSFGVYAGFAWDFLDDFTLEGGVRYNWQKTKFDYARGNVQPTNPDAPLRFQSVTDETWDAPTGSLSLNYRLREDMSVYWKYSRGWKPGTFNANTLNPEEVKAADPEFIDSFETGLKGRWLEGRLALGAALFYYKYVDYQVFVVTDAAGGAPVLQIINANDAEVYGAEVDTRIEPLAGWVDDTFDGLVITGRFGWLESQFLDFTDQVFGRDLIGRNRAFTLDYSGNQLINSPRFKVSGTAEWTFDFGRWGSLIPRYDFSWTDDVYFDPNEGRGSIELVSGSFPRPEFTTGQAAFWLHNIRFAYRTPDGNVEFAFWARNLADQAYKTYGFDASRFAGVVINFQGKPRTIGMELSVNW